MKSPLWILNTMLALLLLVFLLIILLVRPHKPARTSLAVTPPSMAPGEATPQIDPSLIYKNDLFGTYQAAPVPTKAEEEQKRAAVPQPPALKVAQMIQKPSPQFLAPLGVSLKGIMYSSNDQDNRAIVSDNQSKKEALYKVGDSILDAEIIFIGSNKVIFIRSNGQQETLFVTQDDAQEDPIYTQKDSWAPLIKQTGEHEYIVQYEPFVQRIQNLAQFIDMLDITTAFQKGKIVGCRVGKFPQNSVGPLLGLQQGDIITSINNIPTTTTTNRVAIYQELKKNTQEMVITVNLVRQGQPVTLHYQIINVQTQQAEPVEQEVTEDSLPTPYKFTNTIDQVPQYANTIQQVQKRDQDAMFNHGGRSALIPRTEM